MNVATKSEKKYFLSLDQFFSRLLPTRAVGRVLTWTTLPAFFLLLNSGIGFLNPCLFTKYLPFVALITAIATLRFKTAGLLGSYVGLLLFILAFFPSIPREGVLWQMGTFFTLALTLYTLLLAGEEIVSCFQEMESQIHTKHSQSRQLELDLLRVKQASEEREKELEEEISRLKEEAELRRIEKIADFKRFGLIQSEIEMLTAQKTEFIEEAREGRAAAGQRLLQLEEQKLEFERTLGRLQEELIEAQEALHVKETPIIQNVIIEGASLEEMEALKVSLAQKEERSNQLCMQLEEKTTALANAQDEIGALESERALFQMEKSQKEELYNRLCGELEEKATALAQAQDAMAESQQKLLGLEKESAQLQIEKSQREELYNHLCGELEEKTTALEGAQAEVVQAQQKLLDAEKESTLPQEEKIALNKALSQAEGLFNQLRAQFEEKSAVLSQTRQELFQAQGQMMVLEKEKALAQTEMSEIRVLEKGIDSLSSDVALLEEEITHLEALVSHILTQ